MRSDRAPSDGQPYPPIADYALLSDCHSAALVSRDASIDWACLRRFDADSVFGRILDWERGGHFSVVAHDLQRTERRYVDDSLVLETTLTTETGVARILDAFSMHRGGAKHPHNQLLRVVDVIDGAVDLTVRIVPRFHYGELRPWLRHHAETGTYSAVGGDTVVLVETDRALDLLEERCELRGEFRVGARDRLRCALQSQLPHELDVSGHPADELDSRLEATLQWWRRWSGRTKAEGPYAGQIRRSATVLKGLTCAPTGALVAAPTTSLPEEIGGQRNWDYRYTWIRDSTLVLAALDLVGHHESAHGFRDFIMRTAAGNAEDLHIMYGLDGKRHLPERELDLDGYRGSRPVRVGNAAYRQVQHDMFGQLLDAAHMWQSAHGNITPAEWRFLHGLVERAVDVWQEPDRGIWEVRGHRRHFVHSKVWLWVAIDRGIRLVEDRGHECRDIDGWRRARDAVHAAVETHGVDAGGSHFVQHFGSSEVDAALLQLPMVGFVKADDERMLRTVDRIEQDLAIPPHGFVHRYRPHLTDDGLVGGEGTFLMCTFWLVNVLAMQRSVDEARVLFERLLDVSNDLGLYAEQYDPASGELLGNFPQAFTHMALINAAKNLQSAAAGGDETPWSSDRVGRTR